ncbi:MAG: hypothetical protein ACI4S2_12295 [Lachnospiraceae bacterium]
MKKVIFTIITAVILCLGLAACGGETAEEPEQSTPLDLTGEWVQVDKDSDMWQEAVISDDEIEINWISDEGETKSLYWAGTYVAPTEDTDSYSWTSENDTSKTDSALLASTAETKDFEYENGVLSYEASAMGTTTIVKLQKK